MFFFSSSSENVKGKFSVIAPCAVKLLQLHSSSARESYCDLDERVEGLLLVVLRDDLRQQCVLALRQLDEGADAVDVRVDLHVKNIVFP